MRVSGAITARNLSQNRRAQLSLLSPPPHRLDRKQGSHFEAQGTGHTGRDDASPDRQVDILLHLSRRKQSLLASVDREVGLTEENLTHQNPCNRASRSGHRESGYKPRALWFSRTGVGGWGHIFMQHQTETHPSAPLGLRYAEPEVAPRSEPNEHFATLLDRPIGAKVKHERERITPEMKAELIARLAVLLNTEIEPAVLCSCCKQPECSLSRPARRLVNRLH